MHSSLVVTSDCKVRGSNPGQGRNLKQDFCFMRTPAPPLGPQHQVPVPVPSLETHLKSEYVRGRPNRCRYVGCKEETLMKSNGRWSRANRKTQKYGRERRWTPILAKAQDTRASPNSLETHLVRKWGTLDTYGCWAQGLRVGPCWSKWRARAPQWATLSLLFDTGVLCEFCFYWRDSAPCMAAWQLIANPVIICYNLFSLCL